MTEKEIDEFLEMFPNLPNPENFPRCFEFYVQMFKYMKNSQKNKE